MGSCIVGITKILKSTVIIVIPLIFILLFNHSRVESHEKMRREDQVSSNVNSTPWGRANQNQQAALILVISGKR
jgi:hypothetical protein